MTRQQLARLHQLLVLYRRELYTRELDTLAVAAELLIEQLAKNHHKT